jgi:(R,R)-butanediol dehydrogenase/meso-butanediol dehydrogenase/diacetyl reductase
MTAATMQAAVYQQRGEITVEERPVPVAEAHDVLVEVDRCGVCGSDLHMVIEGWGQPGSIGGHEWSGRVVAVGDAVERWSVGDLVVGGPNPTCGRCAPCLAGRPSLCQEKPHVGSSGFQGAFAQYVRAHESSLARVPDGMDLRTAALAEPLAVALHGITRAGNPGAGTRALVTGAGPIGLLTIAALRARGVEDIVVSEPAPARQEAAYAVGASEVVGPDALEAPVMPQDVVEAPFDVALECSGHAVAMEACLGQLEPMGTLVLVGAGIKRPRFDPNRILLNELLVTGAFEYDADGFDHALALLASGALPVEHLLAPTDVPLAGLLGAMQGLFAGNINAKVLVAPNETGR